MNHEYSKCGIFAVTVWRGIGPYIDHDGERAYALMSSELIISSANDARLAETKQHQRRTKAADIRGSQNFKFDSINLILLHVSYCLNLYTVYTRTRKVHPGKRAGQPAFRDHMVLPKKGSNVFV